MSKFLPGSKESYHTDNLRAPLRFPQSPQRKSETPKRRLPSWAKRPIAIVATCLSPLVFVIGACVAPFALAIGGFCEMVKEIHDSFE